MTNPLVLVVEDDERLAQIYKTILEHDGFDVEFVLDGQLALTRLADIKPVVVVLDLHLPNVSGQEILRNIRADERLDKTLVVAATADLSIAEEVRKESDLVLTKPFKPSILSKAIARLLLKYRSSCFGSE